MSAEELKDLIPLAKFRDILGVSDSTIRNWRTKGHRGRKLSVVKFGGLLFVTPKDIDDFRVIMTAGQTPAA